MSWVSKVFLAAALVLLASCNPATDVPAAEKVVADFRTVQSTGDARAVYDAADPAFRDASPFETMQLLMRIYQRVTPTCGPMPSNINSWRATSSTQGRFVTLEYVWDCPEGPLSETFMVRLTEDGGRVAGYHLNGPSVITALAAPETQTAPAPSADTTAATTVSGSTAPTAPQAPKPHASTPHE